MKTFFKSIKLAFVVLILGIFASFSSPGTENTIEISGGVVKVSGVKVSPDFKMATFVSILGKDFRDYAGTNIVHTYDALGIKLFENAENKVGTGIVNEADFYFSKEADPNSVSPTGIYNGTFKVDNFSFTASSSSSPAMSDKLDSWKQTHPYAHSTRFSKDGIYFYAYFAKDDRTIVSINIGKEKK